MLQQLRTLSRVKLAATLMYIALTLGSISKCMFHKPFKFRQTRLGSPVPQGGSKQAPSPLTSPALKKKKTTQLKVIRGYSFLENTRERAPGEE